jgi:hypothetical protein
VTARGCNRNCVSNFLRMKEGRFAQLVIFHSCRGEGAALWRFMGVDIRPAKVEVRPGEVLTVVALQ